jgi:hypothetical protein
VEVTGPGVLVDRLFEIHAVSAQEQEVCVMERHGEHPTPGGVSHVYFYTPDDRLADSTDWSVADLAPQPELGILP